MNVSKQCQSCETGVVIWDKVSKAVLLFIDNFLIWQHLTKQKQHKHVHPSYDHMLTDRSLVVNDELISTTLASFQRPTTFTD